MHSAALCRTSASEILDLRKKLSYDIFGLTYLELIVYLKLITVDIFSYLLCFDYIDEELVAIQSIISNKVFICITLIGVLAGRILAVY